MQKELFLVISAGIMGSLILLMGIQFSSRADNPHEHFRHGREFCYEVVFEDIPRWQDSLFVWIPLPQSNRYQTIRNLKVHSPGIARQTTEPEYGNRMLFVRGLAREFAGQKIRIQFAFRRKEVRHGGSYDRSMSFGGRATLRRYLEPDSLVPIDGEIARRAREVEHRVGKSSVYQLAHALFRDVLQSMKYDKSGTGWGRGDALFACDAGRGNCTDYHSLFVGMARALGIPARFIIGFPLPAQPGDQAISGYHCWAEFWDETRGWVPVDISEADKHPEKRELLFGGLDSLRIQFTMGRDIQLAPPRTKHRLNYFIYPYMLLGGEPFRGYRTHFSVSQISEKNVSGIPIGSTGH